MHSRQGQNNGRLANGSSPFANPNKRYSGGRGFKRKILGKRPWFLLVLFLLLVFVIVIVISAVSRNIQEQKRIKNLREFTEPYQDVFADNIYINDIAIGRLSPEEALSRLISSTETRNSELKLDLIYNNWNYFTITLGSLGAKIQKEDFFPLLNEAWNLTHTGDLEKDYDAIKALQSTAFKRYTQEQGIKEEYLDSVISQIAAAINKDPVDAELLQFRADEKNPFVIRNEEVGVLLDTEKMKHEVLERIARRESGKYQITPTFIQPKIFKKDIEKTVALRAEAITKISKDSSDNRTSNIRVSFSRFNGMILEPGEKFSFNKVVGPRTLKHGFYEAFEQSYGDLVIGVGGGVCQASTTLYQAVLMANLAVLDRSTHGTPVLYTDKGQDATVFYTNDRKIDFKFQNNSGGRIYITAHVEKEPGKKNFISRIKIYGLENAGGAVYRLKSIVNEILETSDIKYIPDKERQYTTYKDETKLFKKAEKGYVVSTYLIEQVNGRTIRETLISTDRYNPKPAQYWQGTTSR